MRVRGPRGAVDDALRQRLMAAKDALLAYLERDAITEDALPRVVPDPARRHEPFPLTDIQEAYWVGSGLEGGGGYHYYLEFDVPGLDVARLERAWGALVLRHEMLRAVVMPDGRQRILPEVPAPRVSRHDLSGLAGDEAEERQAALRRTLSHPDRPLDRWPLSEVHVSLRAGGLGRVHVSLGLITLDSGSMMILFAEWQRLYEDAGAALPPLPTSFRDYVLAERALQGTPLFQRAERYWQRRVEALPPAPALPLAPRQPRAASRFGRMTGWLPAPEWAALKQRAVRHGLTPSALLLAAFSEILAGWSESPRFTLNLTLFNRLPMGEAIGAVVGDFTSVTLLEVDFTARRPFVEHAAALNRQLREDLDHRTYPGVRALREWARRQGVTGRALAPVVFSSTLVLDTAQGFSLGRLFGGTLGYAISQTPQCDLDHQLMEDDGALVFHWDVLDGRYPEGMVTAMFGAYTALLSRLAAGDEAFAEARGPAIPAAQQSRRDASNNTAAPMGEETLCELFARQVASRGDAPAVIAGEETLSYRELDLRARRVAGWLLAQGASPDAPVAVVMRKGWAQPVAVLGTLMAGCAYLPVDAALPPARRAALLQQAGARQVLCDALLLPALSGSLPCLAVDAQPADATAAEPRPAPPDGLAYVLFTSGSTGQPKGVMIGQRGVVQRMQDVVRRFGLGPQDRVLGLTALHHDLSVFDIFGVLCCAGGTLVLPDADGLREPAHWRALMARHGVTLWNSVPAFLSMLADELEATGGAAPPLRWCILSGDFIPVTLPDRIRGLVPGLEVVAAGGPTETTVWDICDPLDAVDAGLPSIPYGRPMANARYHVLRENLDPCPDWVPGELCIAGAGLAHGYWRDEAATARAFIRHPVTGERLYRSGDMGRWLPDGRIEILARQDFQVKLQGQRIELGEIEAALERMPGVARAVVTLQRLPAGESRLVAHMVPAAAPPADAWRLEFKLGQPGLRRAEPGQDALPLPTVPEESAAFLARQSHRRFTGRAVPAAALSGLLAGLRQMPVPGAPLPKRLYPSAGSLYPLQAYLHVRPGGVAGVPAGFHYYDPSRHALLPVGGEEAGPYAGSNAALLREAAFVVLLVGALDAVEPAYPGASRDFCLLEAGHAGQVLMQRAAALEIGLCPLGQGVEEAALRRACGLGDRHVLAYTLAGGGIDPAWSGAWMANDAPGAAEAWHAPLRR
ncbi:amino acid adenylation domain-containing protein, partial [Teichococcus wenyumeiae]